jgi:TonB-linked SusC/RagA family outer membrane protein
MNLKPYLTRGRNRHALYKILLIMKLIIILLTTMIFQVSANSFAQKITLNKKNVPLNLIIKDIRKQSGYDFIYNLNLLKRANPVSINVQNADLKQVLMLCFENQPFTYVLEDKAVIVKEKQKVDRINTIFKGIDVSGKVSDEKGGPIPGATIKVKGAKTTAITDVNGRFTIKDIEENAVLVISFIGFETKEVNVGTSKTIDVVMVEQKSALNEVVVVGYGTQKKSNITGAVSILNMSERENQPHTNVSQALHGVSGLWVNQAGGKPGQDAGTIRIRGVGTLNNSNPLVLVDGIEYNMNDVNPDFIESVTVLKDASAAIYGSRAANGVILVTTKQGAKGVMKIDYNFSQGIQKTTAMPDVEWDAIRYMQLKNQALRNEGKTAIDYSDALIEDYKAGMQYDPLAYPSVDWFDEVLKDGDLQQHNLRFSGGNNAIIYNLGLGYSNHDGILIDANNAKRYTLNLNLTANVTNKLKVGANIIGNYRRYTEPAQGSDATNYYFNRLMRALPIYGTYLPDGRYANLAVATPSRSGTENLIQYLKEGTDVHRPERLLAKVFAEYKLPFDIKYNVNFALDKLDGYSHKFEPILVSYNPLTWIPSYAQPNASAESYNEHLIHTTIYQTLDWGKKIKDHNLSAMLGQSYENYDRRTMTARIEGYFDNSLTDLNAGSLNPTVSGGSSRDILASYFGRLGYDYKGKYFLDATFRYDGSSRFNRDNRWGFFPAVSAGWRLDQEEFLQKLTKNFNLLKLRASVGQLGNQQTVSLYSYMNTVTLNQDYSFNGNISSGAAVTSQGDPNISWEKTTTYNIGLDAELWNGKLGGNFDVFKRRTSGILRPVGIPAQVGALTGPTMNVGVVDNTGYELNLTHRNDIGKFNYSVVGGISFVKNQVVDLNGETIISGRRIIKEGYPIDSYYLLASDGIYQSIEEVQNSVTLSNAVKPGYVRYVDQNDDKKIDGDDRVITGSSIPKYNYSFGLNLGYKDFSLNTFFQGVQGINIFPTANLAFPFNNGAGVTKEWATDSWTPENPNASLPILTTATGATENYQNSTFWLKDASYLRLKNIQLNYSFPKALISKLSLSKLTVFVNGQNLLTFSKYKMFDPEKNIGNDNMYEYPSLKTYSFGLSATF